MQVFDIIILILVGWLTLRGAMKGMVSQLASIAAVIASFWAAVRFGPVLEPVMRTTFNATPPWDKVLGITFAFVGASIAVMFVHRLLVQIISVIHLRKFDRLCGALFGFLKGVLIGMILTFFAVMLSEQTRQMATQSRCGGILVRLIQRTQTLLPNDVSVLIESNLEGFQKQLESGKDTADGTIAKVKDASKTATEVKNALETIQNIATPLMRQITGNPDPADTTPSLLTDTSKNTLAEIRDYPMPQFTASYPPTFDNGTSPPGTTSGTPSPTTGSVTAPTAILIVSPSADKQPIISTAAPPTLPNGKTDWQTLLREMR